MVQEELSGHEVEWEVVESPSEERHADFVVETLEVDVGIVAEPTLPAQNREALDDEVQTNDCGGAPPDGRVTDEVDLPVVFAPKVDTATERWPGRRA
jgi:hypothetical protein